MRFSQNFLFLAPNRSHLPVAWYTRLRIGAIFRLWHQNWCRFRERDFCRGIKIDAILITSSLIPSRLSHLARVIFQKIYFLYLFPVGSDEIEGILQKFFLSLIRTGRGRFSRCFWKNLLIFCYCAGIRILPLHLLHVWKPFCDPLTYSQWERHFFK